MTKIDIFSGFLGAGKTTLIKKLIKEAYAGEKLVLIGKRNRWYFHARCGYPSDGNEFRMHLLQLSG